ncbi:MAG: FkbM family methyltransferase [Candidatus Omnitrophica bacterium]|nr:FkbM family methyltransferase [Candidatus Omnitrophota bacterium]
MINFSKLTDKQVFGKIVRLPLKIIPGNLMLPVLQGPNKGFRWIKGSGVNGYWLGSYESEKQRIIADYVEKGMICYDIGVHVGFYTLMFSRWVGYGGRVYAFEPLLRNIKFLKKHLEMNKIKNAEIVKAAVSQKGGIGFFKKGASTFTGQVNSKGSIKVKLLNIDKEIQRGYIQPADIVKIDVEGAELDVLESMKCILKNKSIKLFVALDDENKRESVFNLFSSLDYEVFNLNGEKITLKEIAAISDIMAEKQ